MREMDLIWELCLMDWYPSGERCLDYVCPWLVAHDSLVMFMLSKIYVSLERALTIHLIEALK